MPSSTEASRACDADPSRLSGEIRRQGGDRRANGLQRGEPRLQRRQPGAQRLGAGLERRHLPGEPGERRRVLRQRLQPGDLRGKRRHATVGLERRDPGDERLGQRLLLGVQAGQLLDERRDPAAGGQLRPRRRLLVRERREPRLEAGDRGRAGLEPGEPGLERPEPGDERLGSHLAALLQRRQPLGEVGAGELRLEAGDRRRLRRLQPVEPLGKAGEQRPRLGRLAHLLDRPHPGPELVEAGERGLERGVLVADEAEQLPGHRLQPLLRGGRLRRERVEPERQRGLGLAERLEPLGHRARLGGEALPAPPEGEPEGAEARQPRRAHHPDSEGLHVAVPPGQIRSPIKRGRWLAAG